MHFARESGTLQLLCSHWGQLVKMLISLRRTAFRVLGHHVHVCLWNPFIGEELKLECEVGNIKSHSLTISLPTIAW